MLSVGEFLEEQIQLLGADLSRIQKTFQMTCGHGDRYVANGPLCNQVKGRPDLFERTLSKKKPSRTEGFFVG